MVYHLVTMTIVALWMLKEIDVSKIGTALIGLLHHLSITAHAVGLGTVHVVVAQESNLVANLQ